VAPIFTGFAQQNPNRTQKAQKRHKKRKFYLEVPLMHWPILPTVLWMPVYSLQSEGDLASIGRNSLSRCGEVVLAGKTGERQATICLRQNRNVT